MSGNSIQFVFDELVPMDEVARTLELARMACEVLHGADRVALETTSHVDVERRRASVNVVLPCGRDLATLFIGFARREFGPGAVTSCMPEACGGGA